MLVKLELCYFQTLTYSLRSDLQFNDLFLNHFILRSKKGTFMCLCRYFGRHCGCKYLCPSLSLSLCPSLSVPLALTFFCLLAVYPIINCFCRLSPHAMRETMRVYSFNYLGIRLTGHLVQGWGNLPKTESAFHPRLCMCCPAVVCSLHLCPHNCNYI